MSNRGIKNFVIGVVRFIFYPISKNIKTNIYFRDIVLCSPVEHLHRTCNVMKSKIDSWEGLTIIDIGCADGSTSVFFNTKLFNTKVIGFEPISTMYQEALIKTKKFENIEIRNKALSDSCGTTKLFVTKNFFSSSILDFDVNEVDRETEIQRKKFEIVEEENVITSTLDIEFQDFGEIALIKIDTQGSELMILKSGIQTLKRTMFILIEMNVQNIYSKSARYYEIDGFLRDAGFALADIVVTYRAGGIIMKEYDALYVNSSAKW